MEKDVLEPSLFLDYGGKQGDAFKIAVEQHLISLTFTDYVEGQSDSLEVQLEDVDRQWQDEWYPQHGDTLEALIGYEKGDLAGQWLDCGTFEIDEVEMNGPPDVVSIKALGAGVKRKVRTRQGKAYEDTTLADIAQQIAERNKLKLKGNVEAIAIARVSQVYEADLPFLKRLADEYGYAFTVKGDELRMHKRKDLKAEEPVLTIKRRDVKTYRFRDKVTGVVESATVSYHDPKMKDTYKGNTSDNKSKKNRSSGDELKISRRAETPEQAQLKADAALERANADQTAASLSMMGNVKLRAGVNVMLEGWQQLDGKYQISQSRHSLNRGAGYTTEIELKRIREAS